MMRIFNGFIKMFIVCGSLISSTKGAGLFRSFLGENENNNRAPNPNISFISTLGLGSNNREVNSKVNDISENINIDNAKRGLLPLLGVNNLNRPIINNLNNNHLPNTNQNNANNNVNDLKKQMAEAAKLLEKLKELNRLKEQQKLEKEKNSQGQDNSGKKPEASNNNKTDVIKDGEGNLLRSITKNKFFRIVQPVVPEDEAINYNQTLYYYD
ncbi:hypothetical protein MSG28_004602 [Choristoneura fumiferana]|uniref:Uncharacterized protein n=1 Tax=Choristoneura fumiferana TaxID=7141 RepID=A0ACC0K6I3_CHOFU|nr:hypothetical protein MSG28_004602 [Choristoneura fumiferana]